MMEMLFSWIHLADLQLGHANGRNGWDRALVLDRLRADIAAWHDYGVPAPDAILVTGDVAFSGHAEEYATARRWLLEVAGSVGLGPDRVFVVPGNHDVNRTADDDRDTRRLVQTLRSGAESLDAALRDPGDRRRLAGRLADYLAFAEGFAPGCLGGRAGEEDALFWRHRFDGREGLRVRLLGLDTALLSAADEDEGKLRLGIEQIDRGLREPSIEPGELVVVLSHHALEGGWLADEKETAPWLRAYAHVHLHGQVYDAGSEAARSGAGGGLVRVAAGGGPTHGYSFASVGRAEGGAVLRVWPRAWSERNKRFLVDADDKPDHQAFAEFPLRVALGAGAAPALVRAPLPSDALFEGPGAMPAVAVPHFVGRSVAMDALRRALEQETACVVVFGTGGIGKTSLARELVATKARELFSDGAAWIDATSLPSELGRVAQRFGWKRERLPTVEEANQWLATALHDRRVLLVVDNADDQQATEIPVPGGRCRTLVTSRAIALHEDLGKPALALPLGKWSDEVCRAYLREISGQSDLEDGALDGLARFVGNLPLAVRLIAKLLRQGKAPRRLLTHLEEQPVDTLDAVARGADRGVKATFLVAYEGLEDVGRQVLLAMSVCARATRIEVVAKVAEVSEAQAEGVLMELWERRSLVEHDAKAERPWGLHDVVRMFVLGQEGAEEAGEKHFAFVKHHLETHEDPTEWEMVEWEFPEVLEAIRRMLESSRVENAMILLNRASEPLERRGYYVDLAGLLLHVLNSAPTESHEAVVALGGLGVTERALGKYEAAIDYLKRAATIAEKIVAPQSLATILSNISACYFDQGDASNAIEYAERAASVASAMGAKGESSASLGNLGLSYRQIGDIGKAVELMRRAYSLVDKLGDLRSQATLLGNIGTCYADLGERQQALDYFERSLDISQRIGFLEGQAVRSENIGASYYYLGQPDKAVEWFNRALAIARRMALSETHPHIRRLDGFVAVAKSVKEPMVQSFDAFRVAKIAVSNLRAIDSIEWSLPRAPGSRWNVVLGENGSGKSTLLRTIGLALVGHDEAAALRQAWGTWVRGKAEQGRVEVTLGRAANTPNPVGVNGAAADVLLHLRLRLSRSAITDEASGDRELWNSVHGSFTAAYGPFRRFTDGDLEYERILDNQPRLARHISLFDSSVALTESLAWLHDLNYKRLDNKPEGKLLAPFTALANDPGPPFFLPHGAHLASISSSGITVKDGNGFDIPIEDLSDGYRAILSLTFDLIRHMANAFGYDHVFDPNDPTVVLPGGIVLIDEIDVHLHPAWQRTVGLWFKKHFPNVQFIVTTHSPLVCQTADSVFYLPAPGSDEEPRMLDEVELGRLKYGNVLDAFGTGVFGHGVTRSEESKSMRQRLVALNRKEAELGLTSEEREEQRRLRVVNPSSAPTLGSDRREGGA